MVAVSVACVAISTLLISEHSVANCSDPRHKNPAGSWWDSVKSEEGWARRGVLHFSRSRAVEKPQRLTKAESSQESRGEECRTWKGESMESGGENGA